MDNIDIPWLKSLLNQSLPEEKVTCSVHPNSTLVIPGLDIYQGIPTNLVINIIVWLLLLICFTILRKVAWDYGRIALISRNDVKKRIELSEQNVADGEAAPKLNWSNNCLWVRTFLKLTDSEIVQHCGRDAYIYLLFQRYLIAYVSLISLLSLIFIVPVNLRGNYYSTLSDFGSLTIANSDTQHMWIHSVMALVYFLLAAVFMQRFSYCLKSIQEKMEADENEQDADADADPDPDPDADASTTLMISHIEKPNEKAIREYFINRYSKESIVDIQFAYNVTALTKMDSKLKLATKARLYSERERQLNGQDKNKDIDMHPYPCGWLCSCCSSRCRKVNAVKFYTELEAKLRTNIEEEHTRICDKPLGIVFVTFSDTDTAVRVCNDFRYNWRNLARTIVQNREVLGTVQSVYGDLRYKWTNRNINGVVFNKDPENKDPENTDSETATKVKSPSQSVYRFFQDKWRNKKAHGAVLNKDPENANPENADPENTDSEIPMKVITNSHSVDQDFNDERRNDNIKGNVLNKDPENRNPENGDPENADPENANLENTDSRTATKVISTPQRVYRFLHDKWKNRNINSNVLNKDPENADPEKADPENTDPENKDPENTNSRTATKVISTPRRVYRFLHDKWRNKNTNGNVLNKDPEKADPNRDTATKISSTSSWAVQFAPSVDNIIWENLSISGYRWWLKAHLLNMSVTVFSFFFTTPVIFVGKIERLFNIKISSVFGEFMPTVLLLSMSSILPSLVGFTNHSIGHWTRNSEHSAVMRKTLIFLLLTVIVVPSLGLTSIHGIFQKNIIEHSQCIFGSDNIAFFVNYVVTSAFMGTGFELLRLTELLSYGTRIMLTRSKAERSDVKESKVCEFHFGFQYAWLLCITAVILTYSVPCPLIAPCGFVYLIAKHAVDRYNIYFAYRPLHVDIDLHTSAGNLFVATAILIPGCVVAFTSLRFGDSQTSLLKAIFGFALCLLIISLVVFIDHVRFGRLKRLAFSLFDRYWTLTITETPKTRKAKRSALYVARILQDLKTNTPKLSLDDTNQKINGSFENC